MNLECTRVAIVVVFLAGCSDALEPVDAAEELFERGPHAVGFRETELTYDPVGASNSRTLPLRVWYPAEDSGEPAIYRVAGIVDVPATGALQEPPVAAGTPFPLAVYSHGFGSEGLLAYPYAELFASHGWVVVSANHTGNSTLDYLNGTEAPVARINVDRPNDITATIDWAEAGFAGEIAGLEAATAEVFVFGHSYGAFTTLASAGADLDVGYLEAGCMAEDCDVYADPDIRAALGSFGDPRVVAVAPQAPSIVEAFVDGTLADLTVPTLMQSARRDQTTPHEEQSQPTWDALDHPDDIWLELPNGGHLSFISICDDLEQGLLDLVQPNNATDGCGPDFTPVATAVPVLAAYTLGFARLVVLGEERFRPILYGEPLAGSVTVSTHR